MRKAIDAAGHPALLMVDSISGLASAEYRHDDWGVDVCISGSQKGLMLPPGISFNALSPKALEASKGAKLPKSFWAWDEMVEMNKTGYFPYTPNTNLLYGLAEACDMLLDEQQGGLERCSSGIGAGARACGRRSRPGAWRPSAWTPPCIRRCSPAWSCPRASTPTRVRKTIYERFDLSLGTGLGKVKGRMFRIGHLGDCNDLTLMAALSGCEMGLKLSGVKLAGSGVQAAMDHFAAHPAPVALRMAA